MIRNAILRINKTILRDRVKDAILSDRNTACYDAKFFKAPNWALSPNTSKAMKSRKLSGSNHYIGASEFQTLKQKRQMEAMFFEKVPPQFITGIIVPSQIAHTSVSNSLAIHSLTRAIPIHTEPTLFPKPGPGVFNTAHAVLDFMDDIEADVDQQDRKRIRL